MAKRALILGSQIDGLRGVGNDTQQMAAWLDGRGFAVDLRVGEDATRDGMLAGYDQLIEASSPDDAAVVYYCGHGFHATVESEGRAWQCIAPTDLRAGTTTDWRGITAWELSIKQKQLTDKTRNVTVILDCCHAAQLSRSAGGAIARALPHPVHIGFDQHLAVLRATYRDAFDAVDPVGNLHAVRVVACGQNEAAFEFPDAQGAYHGVLTSVLIDLLTQADGAPVSWAALTDALRSGVMRRFVRQRPDIEGPVHRAPFLLAEHQDPDRVAVTTTGEQIRLAVGHLGGAAVGDVYRVLPAPDDDGDGPAELELTEVSAMTATARRIAGAPRIPADARAAVCQRRRPKWPIAITGTDVAQARNAIDASATLRATSPGAPGVIATLRVTGDEATIEDADGPMFPSARLPAELPDVLAHLAHLGVAQGIRELEGEHGVRAGELTIELGQVCDGRIQPLPDHGALLGLGDRYSLRVERRTERLLFAHVLSVNARGKISILTHFARGGIVLDRRNPAVTLGQRADGAVVGVGLRWPEGLPRTDAARLTELFIVATSTVTELSGLETRDLAGYRSGGNRLHTALSSLGGGLYRDASGGDPRDGFLVKRLSFLISS